MPKLWVETIAGHRREVREAVLDTTAALVAEHGIASVTMSQIAETTGIGRATLYKYFPDVEAILVAWHERHVTEHLAYLVEIRDRVSEPGERLEAVLEAYAVISYERTRGHHPTQKDAHPRRDTHTHAHGHHAAEVTALVHRSKHVAGVQRRLRDFLAELVSAAATSGHVRRDVAPSELATYCLHALAAASSLSSKTAVQRLVAVTLAGLRPGATRA